MDEQNDSVFIETKAGRRFRDLKLHTNTEIVEMILLGIIDKPA